MVTTCQLGSFCLCYSRFWGHFQKSLPGRAQEHAVFSCCHHRSGLSFTSLINSRSFSHTWQEKAPLTLLHVWLPVSHGCSFCLCPKQPMTTINALIYANVFYFISSVSIFLNFLREFWAQVLYSHQFRPVCFPSTPPMPFNGWL